MGRKKIEQEFTVNHFQVCQKTLQIRIAVARKLTMHQAIHLVVEALDVPDWSSWDQDQKSFV